MKTARYEESVRRTQWPVLDPLTIDDAEFLFRMACHVIKCGAKVALSYRKCSRTNRHMLVLERGLFVGERLLACESCLHVWRESYGAEPPPSPRCQLCQGPAKIVVENTGDTDDAA
jgi:hypothetical protein